MKFLLICLYCSLSMALGFYDPSYDELWDESKTLELIEKSAGLTEKQQNVLTELKRALALGGYAVDSERYPRPPECPKYLSYSKAQKVFAEFLEKHQHEDDEFTRCLSSIALNKYMTLSGAYRDDLIESFILMQEWEPLLKDRNDKVTQNNLLRAKVNFLINGTSSSYFMSDDSDSLAYWKQLDAELMSPESLSTTDNERRIALSRYILLAYVQHNAIPQKDASEKVHYIIKHYQNSGNNMLDYYRAIALKNDAYIYGNHQSYDKLLADYLKSTDPLVSEIVASTMDFEMSHLINNDDYEGIIKEFTLMRENLGDSKASIVKAFIINSTLCYAGPAYQHLGQPERAVQLYRETSKEYREFDGDKLPGMIELFEEEADKISKKIEASKQ